jgi:hypothetical protein
LMVIFFLRFPLVGGYRHLQIPQFLLPFVGWDEFWYAN